MKFIPRNVLCNRKKLLIFPSFVFVILACNYYYFLHGNIKLPEFSSPTIQFQWHRPSSKFWHVFAPLLVAAAPKCPPPHLNGKAHAGFASGYSSWRTKDPLNLIDMSGEDVDSMRRSHDLFVDLIEFDTPKLDFVVGTTGIVTSAGGKYFPVLLVSLLMLRRTGSALPVEVFLATEDEYEAQICEAVFPALNARCIVLTKFLESSKHQFVFSHYQLKIFAMLFSSFESLLFLDADNFPVQDPEPLFTSDPFTSSHLVLWNDYWTPTVSPYFNTITGIPISLLQNRSTIESGQILVSKPHHAKTLMLAAYYNAYGSHYYDLITQGGPGEGDKDTFSTAALALRANFHTVSTPPRPLGERAKGAAVLQFDPRPVTSSKNTTFTPPLFIHASWPPKLNALENVREIRQWGTRNNSMELFGEDIEMVVWGYMVEMACGSNLEFKAWGDGNKSSTGVCKQTKGCFRNMFEREYERVER